MLMSRRPLVRGGVHPGQEARILGENPRMHGENMQNSTQEDPLPGVQATSATNYTTPAPYDGSLLNKCIPIPYKRLHITTESGT
ncbi:hypothetical protein AMECASPLE_034246 [Ameca splendens]|uniref:Uncharacterized protein n=1 Tax=Ameca splendens TaxID=208324 RepID=A0ABV0ZFW1_9TELE